jgi:deazaflavin-dependent oxidoreductase (nitroreductase family)
MPLRYVDPKRRTTAVSRAFTRFGRSRAGQTFGRNVVVRTDRWLLRVTNGRVSWGMFNAPSATLKMTGAKTGQPREAPIAYFHDGRDVILIASNFGGDRHPQWYYNLVSHPDCELAGEAFRAAEVADPADYARLYALAERSYPGYSDYKAKAAQVGRTIPVFRLTPLAFGG